MSKHVIVIGGGVVGLFTALSLRSAGVRVTLIERGRLFAEASWAGAGVLFPMQPWRYPPSIWARVRNSLPRYREMAAVASLDIGLRRSGAWIDGDSPEAMNWCAGSGLVYEPQTRHGRAGLRLADVWQVRNPRLGRWLAARACQSGIGVMEYRRVEHLTAGESGVGLRLADGERLVADAVALCAGAWTDELLRASGMAVTGIAPVKGELLSLDDAQRHVRDLYIGADVYLVPRGDGRVLLGATQQRGEFDPRPTPAARRHLLAAAAELCPLTADMPVTAHWTGLRPLRDGGEPLIGAHPDSNRVFINAGHFRNGLGMAPATADELAAIVTRSFAPAATSGELESLGQG